MSHTWFVRLPPQLDDHSRVDDAALLAGLRGGVVAEKPITVVLELSRMDVERGFIESQVLTLALTLALSSP